MSSEIAPRATGAEVLENVIIKGDLAQLAPLERVTYYNEVCKSVGLNPYTKPFEYIRLNNKLTLYALKGATDQLRSLHGVSIEAPKVDYVEDLIIVSVVARDKAGRTDADTGAVNIAGLKGEAKANAIMKAITKAKRRVTLSMCGLGMLDETEVETIPDAKAWVEPTQPEKPVEAKQEKPVGIGEANATRLSRKLDELGVSHDLIGGFINHEFGLSSLESYATLTKEQSSAVWQYALSVAAKEETRPVWETWKDDSEAQAYGAQAKVFGSGQELMTLWADMKKMVWNPDLLPGGLYQAWFDEINRRAEAERKAA